MYITKGGDVDLLRSDIQPLEASDIKKPHTSFLPGRVARRNKHQASPMNSGEGNITSH